MDSTPRRAAATPSPQTAMTLSIGCEDAQRMLTASKALNESVARLQKEQQDRAEEAASNIDASALDVQGEPKEELHDHSTAEDQDVPKRVVSVSDSGSVSSSEETAIAGTAAAVNSPIKENLPQVHKVLLEAASTCGNDLISSFLTQMKAEKRANHEIETCLLLFLDMDKSSKLLTAFNVLGDATKSTEDSSYPAAAETTNAIEKNAVESSVAKSPSTKSTDATSPPPLNHECATMLFKSFLTSISICIHHDDRTSLSTKRDSPSVSKNDVEEKPRKAMKENEQSSPTSSSKSTEEETQAEESEQATTLPASSPSFDAATAVAPGQDKTSTDHGTEAVDNTSTESPDRTDRESIDSTKQKNGGLSDQTRKEITEIANFAADRLLEHVRKKSEGATLIPFEDFGEWYNSGGYSIVPWLELLDLAKWNYAGQSKTEEPAPSSLAAQPKAGLATIKEEPQARPARKSPSVEPVELKASPTNFFKPNAAESVPPAPTSRVLVSFDFTGAMSSSKGTKQAPFSINITEENLLMLRNLVYRTGLVTRSPEEVCSILLRHSTERVLETGSIMVLHRDDFGRCIRDLVPPESSRRFSRFEMENFSSYFTNFFTCFDNGNQGPDQVNVKEFAVGFSFLCTGNKSTKLASGFELLNGNQSGQLTKEQLVQYLRSYLTMLAGISLLSATPTGMAEVRKILEGPRREEMFIALDNGAKWTLGHFLKEFGKKNPAEITSIAFEDFARWYTDGGFNIAPWLELLDLSKLLTLLNDGNTVPNGGRPTNSRPDASNGYNLPGTSSPRQRPPQDHPVVPPVEVLFTFPLANHRSLVVLREDATYVRSVVEKLDLVNMSPEEVWSSLYNGIKFNPPRQPWSNQHKSGVSKNMDVDQTAFVSNMEGVIVSKTSSRKRSKAGNAKVSSGTKDTLVNFFQSFDLEQVGRVPLNQLMGGLALLCGGKKSTKLAFAFGLFDSRSNGKNDKGGPGDQANSLNGEELFLFLRSFLIVMFSCCRQSLDLSADCVGRYIADTSHMVAEDVMRYQWHTNKRDRVDFDEFGEWYNEGGFESAPWLELLDLSKWVMADNVETVESRGAPSSARAPPPNMPLHAREGLGPSPRLHHSPKDFDCPPPPPDAEVDPSFFGDDEHAMMPLGSMDEMDYMLMQQPSQDKENEGVNGNRVLLPLSPQHRSRGHQSGRGNSNSLKFHLVTNEDHGGYMLSISQRRVRHIRHILVESGLCRVDAELACKKILSKATIVRTKGKSRGKKTNGATDDEVLALSKDDFDSAMRSVITGDKGKPSMSPETQRTLSDLLGCIFDAFDRSQTGMPAAMEVACGFMVLCDGKKSDKLEYAFELLDKDKDGKLSRRDMGSYLRSFLTALLSISSAPCLETDTNEDCISLMNGSRCDRSANVHVQAVDAGSSWAASQAFKSGFRGKSDHDAITFDDFAEWYTNVGYSSIPWLELLDLRKWALADG